MHSSSFTKEKYFPRLLLTIVLQDYSAINTGNISNLKEK